jgi:hypothetical protein
VSDNNDQIDVAKQEDYIGLDDRDLNLREEERL